MVAGESDFVLRVDDARMLAHILKPLDFAQTLNVGISKDGVEFCTHKSRSIFARTFLEAAKFGEFKYTAQTEEIRFWIDTHNFLTAIDLYGHAFSSADTKKARAGAVTVLELSMGEDGLEMVLEDDGIISLCKFAIFNDSDIEMLDFDSAQTIVKVILSSTNFGDALKDVGDVKDVTFRFSTSAPQFVLSGVATTGSTDVVYSNESIEYFESQESFITYSYALAMIPLNKALSMASKVSIRLNGHGILSIQLMMPLETKEKAAFVEYLCVALEDT